MNHHFSPSEVLCTVQGRVFICTNETPDAAVKVLLISLGKKTAACLMLGLTQMLPACLPAVV